VRLDHVARIIVNPDDARHDRLRNNCDARRVGYGAAVKYWEIIIENLRNAGWNCGCISSTDRNGRQFWVVAAEREDAGRFVVHADQELPAFLELESAIQIAGHNLECDCPEPDEELRSNR
jgi:hypothetical protein